MASTIRWSIAAFCCFGLALLAILAANFPPGRSAPMVCFGIAAVFAIIGLVARFLGLRKLNRHSRRSRATQRD